MAGTFAGRPIFKPLGTLALLTVTGLATLLGGFYSSGNSTIGGTLTLRSLYATSTNPASPSIYASGTSIFNDITINGACTGCGGGSLSGGIADSLTFWNSSSVVSASSTLTYSSSTGLFSVLGTVSSTAINTGNITAKNNNAFDVGSYGKAFKDVYSSGTVFLTVLQNAGTLTQIGASTFTGTLTINNLTTFNGNATPGTNNSRDLGSVSSAWKDIYSSGTTRLGTLSNDGNTTFGDSSADTVTFNGQVASTINPNANNTLDLGTFGNAWRNINASGTLQVGGNTTLGDNAAADTLIVNARYASTLQPSSNNTRSLGAFGFAWSNIFASGTIFVNNVSSSNITASSLAGTGAGDVQLCYTTTGVFTQGGTCGVSSMYYKEHIMAMKPEDALKEFVQLRAVTYDYKPGIGADDDKKEYGYIAEEVAMIDPTLVVWAESTPEHVEWTEKNWPSLVRIHDGKKYVPNGVLYERVSVLQGAAFTGYMEKTNARLDKQESLITKLFKIIEKILTKVHI